MKKVQLSATAIQNVRGKSQFYGGLENYNGSRKSILIKEWQAKCEWLDGRGARRPSACRIGMRRKSFLSAAAALMAMLLVAAAATAVGYYEISVDLWSHFIVSASVNNGRRFERWFLRDVAGNNCTSWLFRKSRE
jgi:hypothetical protein